MKNLKKYICFELGGTNIRTAIIDDDMNVIEFDKISTKVLIEADDKSKCIAEILKPLVEKVGKGNVITVTLILSSLLDKDCRYVYSSPMVKGFNEINLADELEDILGLPVIMEKDVNGNMLYECYALNCDKEGIIVGVFFGTGLGNALMIDGKIYRGASGSSCELGHIPIPNSDEYCECGKKGCIELKGSGNVLRIVADALKCDIKDIFIKHKDDEKIIDIIKHIACAVATEISILDPKCVILGGGMVFMEEFPIKFLIDEIRVNLRSPNPRNSVKIEMATGHSHAGVVGAVLNAKLKCNN